MIDGEKKSLIKSILNVIETGSIKGNYGDVSIFNDGPGEIKQITYGRSQTTQYSSLDKLLNLYIEKGGIYGDYFRGFKMNDKTLVNNKEFVDKLKKAGNDPVMIETQDEFFDSVYWMPAQNFFVKNGFTTALSMLVLYDSYIHSGSIPSFLRNKFNEKPPIDGGDEKKWILAYVSARHNWLANHPTRPILRKTIYRTQMMKNEIARNNWQLDIRPILVNGIKV